MAALIAFLSLFPSFSLQHPFSPRSSTSLHGFPNRSGPRRNSKLLPGNSTPGFCNSPLQFQEITDPPPPDPFNRSDLRSH
ncbi:hypothetical protein SLA2020_194070 [Shorea laevis]